MKKKMLMLLTSMLLVCMMAANIAYAATADGTDTASDTVTRAQWLSRLADTFGFEVDQDNYPDNYYADITSDSEYYSVIMMATEFGVLDIEAGENVYPDQPATREFAAQTLNYCLGFQLDSTEYTYSDSADTKYPADLQVAVNRGWFALEDGKVLPAQNITAAEMTAMLADAAAVQESTVVDDNHDDVYTFADSVKVMSKTTQASVDADNVVRIKSAATKIEKGDTFVVWPSALPGIYVAESVTVADGVTTITTSEADTSKAIKSVDASGNVAMDLSQFQEEDGVSVQYSQAGDSASLAGITTGTNSVTATKDITLSNGAKASVTCELSNLTLSQNINTANHTFYVSIKGKSNISSTVTLDAVSAALGSSSVTLGSVRVAGVGTIKLSVDLALNGKITASYAGSFETGMQYSDKDGFRITKSFQKESFTTTAEANASLGVKLEAGLDVYVVKGTLYAKTGISAKFKSSNYNDGKTPKNCTQISAWLYVSVGAEASVNILVWSKSWTKDLIVYDETNSPVRLSFHYEDGKQVSACSRKDSGSKASTKYITSGDSKYGTSSYGDVSSKGTDSEGNEITLWEYTISDDYATITAYKGNAKAVAVPQVLDGYKVTKIDYGAFKNNRNIVRVSIPEGVESIDHYVFSGCTALKSVTLPETLTSIGSRIIENTAIESITIPKGVVKSQNDGYGNGSLVNCKTLKTVIFEDGMITIPAYVCLSEDYTSYIETVVIPDTIENIGGSAFSGCDHLKEITIPEGVVTIGAYAFEGCKSVDSLVIPKTVTTIGSSAFQGCTLLESVTMQENNKTGFKVVIDSSAFSGCVGLEKVSLPRNVRSIGSNTFSGCTALESIVIPEGVESIDSYVFSGCTALKSVTLPETLTSIGSRIIENTAIESITIPKGVVKSQNDGYGNGSLVNCKTLKTVIFEDGMITIPAYVCLSEDYTSYIETVVIPDTIENIGGSAFSGCDHLKEITIPEGVVTIGAYAFEGCKSVDSLVIPKTVTTIGSSAFQGCTLLESVTMQENNKTGFKVVIDSSAFSGCVGLEKVSLPRNVRSIGSNTFSGCTALESIVIPEGVESIDSYVFSGCTALKSVTFPETLTSVGYRIIEDTAVESITIPKNVTKCDYNSSCGGPLYGCKTLKNVVFEEGMTAIPAYACCYAAYLESVTIPSTVTSIGSCAFSGCTNLKTVNYLGTADTWKNVTIGTGNDALVAEIISYHTHKYDQQEVVAPTCTTAGYTLHTCSACGNTYKTDSKAALGHTEVVTAGKDATCTEDGISEGITCSVCGLVIKAQTTIPAKGHDYKEKITKKATCEADGTATYTCTVCGDTYDDVIKATGHDFSITKVTKKATCVEDGIRTLYCSACGTSKEETIPATGEHTYKDTIVPGTCKALGYTLHECTVCGDSYKDTYTPMGDHTWDDGVVTKEATTTETGIKTYTCTVCGETNTEIIPVKTPDPDPEKPTTEEPTTETPTTEEPTTETPTTEEPSTEETKKSQKFVGTDSYTVTVGDGAFALDVDLAEGDGALTFETSDENVVRVSSRGLVTVNGAGTATITVNAAETKAYYSAVFTITVTVKQKTIIPDPEPEKPTTEEPTTEDPTTEVTKKTQKFTGTDSYTKTDGDGAFALDVDLAEGDGALTFVSSDDKVVKVSSRGLVTVVGAGTAKITVNAAETTAYYSATFTISVTVKSKPVTPPKPAVLKNQVITARNITKTYTAAAFGLGAKTNGNGKLTYKSSNTGIVRVNSKGRVSLKGYGKVKITINAAKTSSYKAASKTITITVKPKKMALTSVKSSRAKTMTVKWKRDSKASMYCIRYSTDKRFKKGVKTVWITRNSATSVTLGRLKPRTKYYVRIAAVKKTGSSKLAGAYSAVKAVTVKK